MIRAYLDNNATTRPHPDVVTAMRPYLDAYFLNPSSTAGQLLLPEDPGAAAQDALAKLLGADTAAAFVLTSGASEANSWVVAALGQPGAHVIASAIEHPSTMAALAAAKRRGTAVDLAPVDVHGELSMKALTARLRPETRLVSVMFANNETGVLQPVAELTEMVRAQAPRALIHCDATQAVGRVAIDLDGALAQVDLLSLSAHKFHGPKGIGALFVRPGVELEPLVHGTQDDGRRGGTLNSAAAAGLAAAARLACERLPRAANLATLRDQLEAELQRAFPQAYLNGAERERLPNTSSVTFPGVRAADVVETLAAQGICIAAGAACSAGATAPSHVLTAMGLQYADALATLRFSLSLDTTPDEIDLLVDALGPLLAA